MFTRLGKTIKAIAALIYGLLRLVIRPNNIDPIFRMRAFEDSKPVRNCLIRLRSDPDMRALMESRFLSDPFDFEALKKLPSHTLGHHFGMFCAGPDIQNPITWPKIEDTTDTDLIYIRRRARQTHDIHHVVLGYPATPIGEVAISAFYVRQIQSPMNAVVVVAGILIALFKKPEAIGSVFDAISKGWKAAGEAKNFMAVRWEDYFEMDLDEVRKIVGVNEIVTLDHVEIGKKDKATVQPEEKPEMKLPSILSSVIVQPPQPSGRTRALIAKNAEEDLARAFARGRGLRIERPVVSESVSQPARGVLSEGPSIHLNAMAVAVVSTEPVVTIPPAFRHHAELARMVDKLDTFEF